MPVETAAVVTGIGIVSPIGVGREAFWASLHAQRSGIGPITAFDASICSSRIAGEVRQFDAKAYVRPRKSLKVMARETQFGVAAADMARNDAELGPETIDPDRIGAVFGADMIRGDLEEISRAYRACTPNGSFDMGLWGTRGFEQVFPLSMLRLLPNMMASHISIVQDARGPNNTICQSDASALLALGEATSVIGRGLADAMIAGGSSSQVNGYDWLRNCIYRELSRRNDDPEAASRPFDAARDGEVRGEGGAALLLESATHAKRRGANVLCRVLGFGSAFARGGRKRHGAGLRLAIERALGHAGIRAEDIGHVVPRGLSTHDDDAVDAAVIRDMLGDVPVTAPKSYFGNLGAGGGLMEAAVSVLALAHSQVPATLNFRRAAADCPVNVVAGNSLHTASPYALVFTASSMGQAAAVVLGAPE